MNLPISVTKENGESFYTIRLSHEQILQTESFPGIICGIAKNKDIVYVDLPKNLLNKLVKFSLVTEQYSEFQKRPDGYRLKISEAECVDTAECMINVDLGRSGNVVSIEII